MADYLEITDTQIEPERPGTAALFGQLRDNPLAIQQGSNGAPKIPEIWLAGGIISVAQATLDIPLTDFAALHPFLGYRIKLASLRPATNDAPLWARTSTNGGASFDLGGTDYSYQFRVVGNDITDSGQSEIVLSEGIGNATGQSASFNIELWDPSAALHTHLSWRGVYSDADIDLPVYVTGAGGRLEVADVDAIQFRFSTGNIASCNWSISGIVI